MENNWHEMAKNAVAECAFPEYTLYMGMSQTGFMYLQAHYDEVDTETGILAQQTTRRWPLSPEMTKSEIVATAFKCALTSMEHKTREWFTYRGRAVYQPHYNVDTLWAVAGQVKTRNSVCISVVNGGIACAPEDPVQCVNCARNFDNNYTKDDCEPTRSVA